jgi:ABC-type transport system substrate-binding protein
MTKQGSVSDRGTRGRLTRRRVVQGGAALVGLGLAACSTTTQAPTPAPAVAPPATPTGAGAAAASPAAAQPKYGGVFRSALTTAAAHFDFHQYSPQTYLNPVLAYSTLLTYKYGPDVPAPSYLAVPDLAETWEQPDELTYLFHLRKGVKFHNVAPVNGREVTSADVQYSLQRVLDLKLLASLLGGVQRMETPDPYTFKITLSEPNADFLVNMAANSLVIAAKEAVAVNGDLKNGPHIGTGPWMVQSADPSHYASVMVRNPDYFLKGLPYVDRLEFQQIPDPKTLVSAFQAKQLDFIGSGLSPVDTEPLYKADPNNLTRLRYYFYSAMDQLVFKSDAPPFNDPRVRKAVVQAIDRQALIDVANGGFAILTSGVWVPDLSWQLSPDVLKPLYKRDLQGAKQLLAQAGQPNLDFELIVPTYKAQVYVTMGEQIQAQLKEAGISARLRVLDSAAFIGAVTTQGQFTVYLGNAGARFSTNADLLNNYYSKGANAKIQSHYNNPQLDALIDQQKVLTRDPQKRRSLLEQIQRTVIDDNIIVSISAAQSGDLLWSYVKGFYLNGVNADSIATYKTMWIDK